jgi:hypothetical protein
MKGMCYIVLIVAFLMFYQREPVFSVIILAMTVGLYLFFRARRSGNNRTRGGIFGSLLGRNQHQESTIDNLVTLMMVQQLFQDTKSSSDTDKNLEYKDISSDHVKHIEKTKQEILEILDQEIG